MTAEIQVKKNRQVIVKEAINEVYISSNINSQEDFDEFAELLLELIEKENISIVQSFVFAGTNHYQNYIDTFKNKGIDVPPFTWISNGDQNSIYGIQMLGIKDGVQATIKENNQLLGFEYSDDFVEYCHFNGIVPKDGISSGADHTTSVLTQTADLLEKQGMQWTDVIRTWFYNKDILDWYDVFNKVRTDYYNGKKIFENIIPASTGIDGCNHKEKHLTLGLLSVKKRNDQVVFKEVDSPLQGSACDYGSSFSRATEINTPQYRKVYVSGTASIDKIGDTIHLNDTVKQVQQTMATVKEILETVEMSFENITRATAYCKTIEVFDYMKKYVQKNNIDHLPIVVTRNIICRDNLLFELEVDAISLKTT